MKQELTSNPLFGLIVSLGVFLLAKKLLERYNIPILNPLVVSLVTVIGLLTLTDVTYEDYYVGGSVLNMLIAPATVALAVPLYRSVHLLKQHGRSILVGIIVGTFISGGLTAIFAVLFRYDQTLLASILPKSVTTAIAVDLSEKMGGIPTVTIIGVTVAGIIGGAAGATVLKWSKVEDPVAKGVALGTASHAIGTAKAMELGEVEGAMSGLAIGVTGIITVFVAPFILQIVANFF